MKKIIFTILSLVIITSPAWADSNLADELKGRILLQVEQNGEAWYINPTDLSRYSLGKPADAFNLMRELSLGISNSDLNQIPVGIINDDSTDSDNDGIPDYLENTLGTDPNKADTDDDDYNDKTEIENNYNPLDSTKLVINTDLISKNLGKIFLQVENNGEAWYLNPVDQKRYFLNRPSDAFSIMRTLGLGITDDDLSQINITELNYGIEENTQEEEQEETCTSCQQTETSEGTKVIDKAASAIRSGDVDEAKSYFTEDVQSLVEYTMNFLDDDGRLTLGNILSGAKLDSSTSTKKTYINEIYFSLGGYKVPLTFVVEKQDNGEWLITNL